MLLPGFRTHGATGTCLRRRPPLLGPALPAAGSTQAELTVGSLSRELLCFQLPGRNQAARIRSCTTAKLQQVALASFPRGLPIYRQGPRGANRQPSSPQRDFLTPHRLY